MARNVIRIEIDIAPAGYPPRLYYLVIEKHEAQLFSPSGGKVRLGLLASDKAMVLRFLLEDATTAAGAVKFIKHVLPNVSAKEWKLL